MYSAGTIFDRVHKVGQVMHLAYMADQSRQGVWREYLQYARAGQKLVEWEFLALHLKPYPTGETNMEAFQRTLIANSWTEEANTSSNLNVCYEACRYYSMYRWAEPVARYDIPAATSQERRFFTTKKGYMGLEPRSTRPGDTITVLSVFEADIAAVRVALVELIDRGLDVVLVGHSYGGAPCLAAAHGLWKSTRDRESKRGGVAKIALISAVITLPGQSVGGLRQEFESKHGAVEGPPPHIEPSDKASTLRPFALEALTSFAPAMNPVDWNIAYLLTENDKTMLMLGQESLIESARSAGANVVVDRMFSDHFPQLSHVEATALWIKGVLDGKK
ncbi:hypothetical protein B0A49_12782 [Cryomyces minteri]|uniref:AB hydrolase-1 domain-containing protein n=1 Tax=Cryomyces minteri TaxID=331657 RepID=A0A4U0WE93_9PEZI|nr:hypothetical protein B0A49_12782 [Cryomyces minteri]